MIKTSEIKYKTNQSSISIQAYNDEHEISKASLAKCKIVYDDGAEY